jgi:hypothetical protein
VGEKGNVHKSLTENLKEEISVNFKYLWNANIKLYLVERGLEVQECVDQTGSEWVTKA